MENSIQFKGKVYEYWWDLYKPMMKSLDYPSWAKVITIKKVGGDLLYDTAWERLDLEGLDGEKADIEIERALKMAEEQLYNRLKKQY